MKKPFPTSAQFNLISAAFSTSALSLTLFSCTSGYYPPVQNPVNPVNPAAPIQPVNPAVRTTYTDSQAYDKYFGYNYVDAKVLANFWGESSPSAAKLRLGHKMLDFGPQEGRIHLGQARQTVVNRPISQWPVWIQDGGYTYNDAERLGRYWGGGTSQAKTKMARNLIQGQDQWNRAALAAAF
jgi:hypothetical protein